jgi:hypothetical protein
MQRNNTSYPMRVTARLRALYAEYERRLAAGDPVASILKYYQFLVRAVMSDPEFGIGADGNARGLLVYHTMGMGKTRLAVAVAMAMWDVRQPVVLLARGLQKNFRETVAGVVRALDPAATPEAVAAAVARFAFVSMDAYNAADQMARAGKGPVKKGEIAGPTGGLDGKLLIVDEAHNFFRAIINSSAENANARRIYDAAMAARNLRIVFCTGTPSSKNPFELVPCFNMLAGFELLPTQYAQFFELYVDEAGRAVRNREKLANRLVGLVSHVTHLRPTRPAGVEPLSIEDALSAAREQRLLVTFAGAVAKISPPVDCALKPTSPDGMIWLSTPTARAAADREGGPSWYEWALLDGNLPGAVADARLMLGCEVDRSRLLALDSRESVRKLAEEYGCAIEEGGKRTRFMGIKWGEVAAKYAGIAVDPYDEKWARDKKGDAPLWYQMFDAVTYCVWDESAIVRRVTLRGGADGVEKQPRDDGWFPEELPTVVDSVPMGPGQYRQYLLAREKEAAEGKGRDGAGARPESVASGPALALPGSERRAASSYHVASRSLATFCAGHDARRAGTPVREMADDEFVPENGPKLELVATRAAAAPGPVLIYSQFVDASGLGPAARYLRRHGFLAFGESVEGGAESPSSTTESPRYAVISGEVDPAERDRVKDAFNSPANVRGAVIKAILVSKTGAEGLDLKYLRETHQVEPYWDRARNDQVKARAVRMGCLDALPREDRVVQPYLYVAAANREVRDLIPERDREPATIDEIFHERAERMWQINQAFRDVLAEVCLECDAFGYGRCRVCAPTNAPLFTADAGRDARLPDPCRPVAAAEVTATPLEYGGQTYYYAPDPGAATGYVFYERRDDLGGYAPVDPAAPIIVELLRHI